MSNYKLCPYCGEILHPQMPRCTYCGKRQPKVSSPEDKWQISDPPEYPGEKSTGRGLFRIRRPRIPERRKYEEKKNNFGSYREVTNDTGTDGRSFFGEEYSVKITGKKPEKKQIVQIKEIDQKKAQQEKRNYKNNKNSKNDKNNNAAKLIRIIVILYFLGILAVNLVPQIFYHLKTVEKRISEIVQDIGGDSSEEQKAEDTGPFILKDVSDSGSTAVSVRIDPPDGYELEWFDQETKDMLIINNKMYHEWGYFRLWNNDEATLDYFRDSYFSYLHSDKNAADVNIQQERQIDTEAGIVSYVSVSYRNDPEDKNIYYEKYCCWMPVSEDKMLVCEYTSDSPLSDQDQLVKKLFSGVKGQEV